MVKYKSGTDAWSSKDESEGMHVGFGSAKWLGSGNEVARML